MTAEGIRVSSGWLALREPADAAARAPELVEHLARRLPATGRRVIHDLGCGTGAMGRWLAPLLPGPQHWVVHDRDADLLEVAAADLLGRAADGAAVTVEARQSDITRLHPCDLADATLITASALLDLLTEDELAGLVTVCAGAACPVLLTLSVVGRVDLTPADPLDSRVAAAFDAHQRRVTAGGRLLGPDAVEAAVEGFGRLGRDVLVRPSPWRLGCFQADLVAEWFAGWVGAACEQAGRARRRDRPPTRAGVWRRRRPDSSPSPWTTPTCWSCPEPIGREDEPDRVGVGPPRGRRCDARRPGLARGRGPVPRRRPHGRRPGARGSGRPRGADHRVLCLAVEDRGPWSRHRPVAARWRWRRTTGRCSSTSRCPAGSWATSTAASATVAT